MSNIKPSNDEQNYRVDLSADEMQYLLTLLPSGYSFQLQPKQKKKQTHPVSHSKKKNQKEPQLMVREQPSSFNQSAQKQQKKPPPKVVQEKPPVSQTKVSLGKWAENVEEPLKRMAKILKQLKASKHSWPFLEPVNVEELGIPEYLQVIKEPMDLSSIEEKLRSGKYSDYSGFRADVLKIIENSYRFNEANQEFLKITSEFESYFHRISNQSQGEVQKNTSKSNKKKKKNTASNRDTMDSGPVTLLEKKQLAQQIRRLGKEHIKAVANIVFDNADDHEDRFDLQKLNHKKLRDLQRFIRGKIIAMEEKVRTTQKEKNEITDLDLLESEDQSPFVIERESN